MTTFYLPARIPTREYPLNHLHYNKVLVMLIFWNWTLPRGIWGHQVFLLLTMKVLVLRHKICLKKPKSTFSKASQLALAALFMLTMYLAVLTTSIVLILEEITILYFFLTFRLTILDFIFSRSDSQNWTLSPQNFSRTVFMYWFLITVFLSLI